MVALGSTDWTDWGSLNRLTDGLTDRTCKLTDRQQYRQTPSERKLIRGTDRQTVVRTDGPSDRQTEGPTDRQMDRLHDGRTS